MENQLVSQNLDLAEITTMTGHRCPCCDSTDVAIFYEVKGVPVHSVLLMPTREDALNYPTSDIALGFCQSCEFITNVAFDPGMHAYSARYEETQGFSSTFNAFHHALATRLIDRYDLHGKHIIEIGCGKGDFLSLLCELGDNRGVGFDPAYVRDRNHSTAQDRLTFIPDFYSERYSQYQGDLVCCKMTLEHIFPVAEFLQTVRGSIGDCSNTVVFFQVPDVRRILRELAFWDIYYEHCSYFSAGSFARVFRQSGFEVIDVVREYDEQYLMLEARSGNGTCKPSELYQEQEKLTHDVMFFARNYQRKLDEWRQHVQALRQREQRVVLWGGGSKGVSFLTTLGIQDEIEYVVDINPHKHGTYMAGSGHEIVAPDFLRDYQPAVVIIMNPIYREEIRHDLQCMGLTPELLTV